MSIYMHVKSAHQEVFSHFQFTFTVVVINSNTTKKLRKSPSALTFFSERN